MVTTDTVSDVYDDGLFPQRVGDRLRAARLGTSLDLTDVATRTRVPMRHLEAIERSDYSGLPSPTYAVGFVKSYARAVGLDPEATARDLRTEIGRAAPLGDTVVAYEPVDPARVPSKLLAWTAVAIAAILLAGYLSWRAGIFDTERVPAPVVAAVPVEPSPTVPPPVAAPVQPPAPIAAAASTAGEVVLTAITPVWLRVYDRHDKVLIGRELAQGESFTVPADADGPMIRTGRADAIRVTVDGREVPPLGSAQTTIRDVGVSAAALAARAASPVANSNAPQ